MTQDECIFCRIARGEMKADIVREDEHTVAFRDINPQAPTHVLVIPRRHVAAVDDLGAGDAELVGRLFLAAREIAADEGLGKGYRMVVNNGPEAGQTVHHIHMHVLGGRGLRWPPG